MLHNFFIYTLFGAVNKSIPFLLIPIITRYLSPAEFGTWSVFQTLIAFALPLVGMNSQNNITRNFFRLGKQQIAVIICNLLLTLTGSFCLLLLLLSALLLFFGPVFEIPSRWITAIPFISFTNMINIYNLTVLRNEERSKLYGIFEIGYTLFNMTTVLILIAMTRLTWQALAIGNIAASLLFGLLGLIQLNAGGYVKFSPNGDRIKEIVRISIPLVPHALGATIVGLSDRLFIEIMFGKTQVGLYTVGYTVGGMLLLFTDSFNKAWSPWLYRQLAAIDKFRRQKIIRFTYLYAVFVFVLAIALSITARYMIDLFLDPAYGESKVYVLWVSMAMAVQGMYFMMFPYPIHVGKTKFLGIITGVTALINLIGNYLLIKLNGPIGAAQSTLISYVVLFLCVWWYSNRIYPMPWFRFRPTATTHR